MDHTLPAKDLTVSRFRQIHHWPLIAKASRPWRDPAWKTVEDPLTLLVEAQDEDTMDRQRTWAVQEFDYFHDTIQRFLYGRKGSEDAGFTLYRRDDLSGLDVTVGAVQRRDGQPLHARRTHHFKIDRLTLHVFEADPLVAVVTLETVWEKALDAKPLTLADVQTLIDHTRRSYTPFWMGSTPARCPEEIAIVDSGGRSATYPVADDSPPGDAFRAIEDDRANDAPIFPHWRRIAGLRLKGESGNDAVGCEWRDPSDERISAMSFVALEAIEGQSARETMLRIGRPDWVRIADAEEAGEGWPYNRAFLRDLETRAFYDRFFPDEGQREDVATRHVFGGAQYGLVTVDGEFARNVLENQFRRHYAQMSLLVRFEHAMLLAFSSAIAEAAATLGGRAPSGGYRRTEHAFTERIVALHRRFLLFVNRFRFTGVSSQDQATEMVDRWRDSLGLSSLYEDVRAELEATSAYVQTRQETRRADAAERLNRIAFTIAAVALVTGIAATPAWDRWIQDGLECAGAAACTWKDTGFWREVGPIVWTGFCAAGVCVAGWVIWRSGFRRH